MNEEKRKSKRNIQKEITISIEKKTESRLPA